MLTKPATKAEVSAFVALHMNLARKVVKKVCAVVPSARRSEDDLMQEASIALVKAIDLWDPSRLRFEQVATMHIQHVLARTLSRARKMESLVTQHPEAELGGDVEIPVQGGQNAATSMMDLAALESHLVASLPHPIRKRVGALTAEQTAGLYLRNVAGESLRDLEAETGVSASTLGEKFRVADGIRAEWVKTSEAA